MDDIELGPLERGFGKALESSSVTDCPTASQLDEFVLEGSRAKSFAMVVEHVSRCTVCRNALSELRAAEQVRATALGASARKPFLQVLRPLIVAGAMGGIAIASIITIAKVKSTPVVKVRPDRSVVEVPPIDRTPKTRPVPVRSNPVVKSQEESSGGGSQSAPSSPPIDPNKRGFPPSQGGNVQKPSETDQYPPMDQLFCLVGQDHVYVLPPNDSHLPERKHIEETYARDVSVARSRYLHERHGGAEREKGLDLSLKRAADQREMGFRKLYRLAPEISVKHPELKVDGTGPYQVVRLDYSHQGRGERPVTYKVMPPWPGYHPAQHPYGWSYHVTYHPDELRNSYLSWRQRYSAENRFEHPIHSDRDDSPSKLEDYRTRRLETSSSSEPKVPYHSRPQPSLDNSSSPREGAANSYAARPVERPAAPAPTPRASDVPVRPENSERSDYGSSRKGNSSPSSWKQHEQSPSIDRTYSRGYESSGNRPQVRQRYTHETSSPDEVRPNNGSDRPEYDHRSSNYGNRDRSQTSGPDSANRYGSYHDSPRGSYGASNHPYTGHTPTKPSTRSTYSGHDSKHSGDGRDKKGDGRP